MKKRNQKLSLNRETLGRLATLPAAGLDQVVAGLVRDALGEVTSCGQECGCVG